jgi:hypothetical protein
VTRAGSSPGRGARRCPWPCAGPCAPTTCRRCCWPHARAWASPRCPCYVAEDSIASGAVLPLLEGWALPAQEIHAVYPSPRMVPAKVTQFIEWLRGQFGPAAVGPSRDKRCDRACRRCFTRRTGGDRASRRPCVRPDPCRAPLQPSAGPQAKPPMVGLDRLPIIARPRPPGPLRPLEETSRAANQASVDPGPGLSALVCRPRAADHHAQRHLRGAELPRRRGHRHAGARGGKRTTAASSSRTSTPARSAASAR